MTIKNAAFGYDRTAASARLEFGLSRGWMSGVGVCPAPLHLTPTGPAAVRIGADGVDATRIDENGRAVESFEQSFPHLSTRQFDKQHLGSNAPRPPV